MKTLLFIAFFISANIATCQTTNTIPPRTTTIPPRAKTNNSNYTKEQQKAKYDSLIKAAVASRKPKQTTTNPTPVSIPTKTTDAITDSLKAKARACKLGPQINDNDTKNPIKNGGYYLAFKFGNVYYNPLLKKCFGINTEIINKWGTENFENGWLGYPTCNNTKTKSKNMNGAYVHFEGGGSIYYTSEKGAFIVKGDIKTFWNKLGSEKCDDIGFPISDEVAMNYNGYTIYQIFENGVLFWGASKPIVVSANILATTPDPDELITPKKYGVQ
jgi:uncharacterized protein with LGFP repeats